MKSTRRRILDYENWLRKTWKTVGSISELQLIVCSDYSQLREKQLLSLLVFIMDEKAKLTESHMEGADSRSRGIRHPYLSFPFF